MRLLTFVINIINDYKNIQNCTRPSQRNAPIICGLIFCISWSTLRYHPLLIDYDMNGVAMAFSQLVHQNKTVQSPSAICLYLHIPVFCFPV